MLDQLINGQPIKSGLLVYAARVRDGRWRRWCLSPFSERHQSLKQATSILSRGSVQNQLKEILEIYAVVPSLPQEDTKRPLYATFQITAKHHDGIVVFNAL